MQQQTRTTERLAGQLPNIPRSAWQSAEAAIEGAGFARAYYTSLALQLRGRLPWSRNKVRGLNVAQRELGDLRAADAPEAEARRYVGTLDRFVDALYCVPVRGEAGVDLAETSLDGDEDRAECELRHARVAGDRVRIARALDACIALDSHLAAIHAERCTLRQREKVTLLAGAR